MRKETTRELIRQFSHAFERPVNERYTPVSITDRLLLGKLLLEETLEYVTKGLGLRVVADKVSLEPIDDCIEVFGLSLVHKEGDVCDPVEIVDGLADVNVIAHFNAHWHGFNLDRATEIVHESNMSKLDEKGYPIINRCVECNGLNIGCPEGCGRDSEGRLDGSNADGVNNLIDPTKPVGKILKGPNYFDAKPQLVDLIRHGDNRP